MEVAAVAPKTVSPKLVPFVCPACAAPNAVGLVALARAGTTSCVSCGRRLSANDVSRAMHSPRATSGARTPAGYRMSGQRGLGGTRPR